MRFEGNAGHRLPPSWRGWFGCRRSPVRRRQSAVQKFCYSLPEDARLCPFLGGPSSLAANEHPLYLVTALNVTVKIILIFTSFMHFFRFRGLPTAKKCQLLQTITASTLPSTKNPFFALKTPGLKKLIEPRGSKCLAIGGWRMATNH